MYAYYYNDCIVTTHISILHIIVYYIISNYIEIIKNITQPIIIEYK